MSTVFLHGVQNGFGLETGSLECCTCDMAFLGVGCDADCKGEG